MLAFGFPLVGLVHIAMGSFLALQAYYGSTFVDGTGAVVGVGLLRNLGGHDDRDDLRGHPGRADDPRAAPAPRPRWQADGRGRPLAGGASGWPPRGSPRPRSPARCCRIWGVAVGTLVGWQASESMMGLPTEMFFMMMLKMMWFRDVVGLIVKGLLFGLLPAAICCYEALRRGFREPDLARDDAELHADAGVPAGDAGLPGDLPVDRRHPDHELELVHAGLSRGPVLRPDAAEDAVPVTCAGRRASMDLVPGRRA